ncbi:hypothetical protein ENSA5_05240 [Enhygromyxa salina]|uniref:Uncharacterized protein n=1 Tax=Enhygromyxa salina TaxID=215803 RepID=A0A2S9YI56_9BACT|nr:hypothetical protein [Enhygromyxa salina]PRQ04759.1 hypothetical protein ENSA5_05240 [Enhygromyxa salina]
MEIGEPVSPLAAGSAGSTEPPPAGKLRLWIVDPRYVPVELGEALEYKVLDGSGQTIASGTLEGTGYVDIDEPEGGEVSVWLDGEVLTAHVGSGDAG